MSGPSSAARLRGLLLVALAALSWGTTGSVTAMLVERDGATPLVIGELRLLLAAGLLLAGAAARGRWRIARGDWGRCVAAGACMAGFQATYFTAVTVIGVALAALIAICCAPLVIAALATAFLGERITARVATALVLGVAGTALLIVGPRAITDFSARFGVGALLALGASLCYALYVVIAKSSLARTPPLPLAGWTFVAAALVLSPALAGGDAGRQIALGWPWLLYLGGVTTAGAYAIYTLGLRDVTASAAGIAALMEPLTATLLGVMLFGERLGVAGVTGAAVLFVALVLLLSAGSDGTRRD